MSVIGKPKLCKNGCNMTIVWYHDDVTGDDYFAEMDANGAVTGQMHRCPNYRRSPESTSTSISTSTKEAEAAAELKPSSANTAEQTMIQILHIVQKIERILSDTTTSQS